MKRAFCLFCCVLVVLSINVSAFAEKTNVTDEYERDSLVNDDGLDEKNFAEENARLEKKGREIILSIKQKSDSSKLRSAPTILDVPKYFQNGESWSNDAMQHCGKTIGHSGCALTSFTMLENYIKDDDLNPGEVNRKLGKLACPLAFRQAGKKFGLSVRAHEFPHNISQVNNFVVGTIDSDLPAIIGLKKGDHTHFVTARGYWVNGDTILMINDPNRYNDYSSINPYLNNGFHVFTLYAFGNY